MALRRHREQADTVRYQMREKLIAIGDDYWIEDSNGNKAFRVNGKALRVRDTWKLEDAAGQEVATIREKKLAVRDSIKIEVHGREAVVKKKIVSIRDKFVVSMDGAPDIDAKGNFVNHEYEMEWSDQKIAEVSKKWFRVRDTYGVEIDANVDHALVLAITVAIDAMSHDGVKD